MKELLTDQTSIAYCSKNEMLLFGDTFSLLGNIISGSADMFFADPPYFLNNDGIICHGGRMVSVNKGNWDKTSGVESRPPASGCMRRFPTKSP